MCQNKKRYVHLTTGRLSMQELLEQRLAQNGYTQSKLTPRLWMHHMRPIILCLVIDDFGVKYVGRENAEHLKCILVEKYEITTDWGNMLDSSWSGTTKT